ncbi:2-succinyl-5-enolpyruvyl-6-hydroxy-3-cyclohexene-1-carboxylic-acid synthase [Shewanella yunxiaonensis]|uniref:2-succinyl-5-enolpyruvyl-6-hydroxy-3-cyclohexene-1-carboxylate synthase n=1 Tax=Shewanella yunxiaonensis TaxID=2829809 RepID=A0ABX7YSZ1_9GAMM|nr:MULTISPECIES: 2-succinyl-5-enolpyruvyl-6-hydroxy-3-cyclohexene-1-carboxylic-acid synthase [Shewanella]MDF0533388.1 2-succinyl-5-enolpyruvyl-6-hydroxy-3-cyclohexene-1-carboxylic-acid synthase [Shewanella sp. A32]QUN05770.1 2-succinyl-5-enolpyruvyl-6-hydroxy-3-cyclohexene-1-carboxylic-acid synthase [Shewanella yunxiaonensis]
MQKNQHAELNLLWGELILEELARLGVQHLCMAPGSRSTPLTLAAAKQHKLQQHLHFDERGLGFYAMGLAKASRAPVAIITTSGTAVANLFPAIVEAWLTNVPLVVLSGDRPPELIACGANQAIQQPGIYGQYAIPVNLPTPDLSIAPQVLLTLLDEAISNQRGPVHINCMFREPLYPQELQAPMAQELTHYLLPLQRWQHHANPYSCYSSNAAKQLPPHDALSRFVHGQGVIVAGTLDPAEQPAKLVELAAKLGWPLLTDAQSQLRQHPAAIGNIDQLLHHPKAKALLERADRVLVFGGRLLSKRLIAYLEQQDWQSYWQVLPQQQRLDPSHKAKAVWLAPLSEFASLNWPRSSAANWALELIAANDQLHQLFQQQIDDGPFGEAQVVRAIAKTQPGQQQLFIGNSLPVRLYDMFAPVTTEPALTYTNRGASGIDGLLATCCGVAAHSHRPTTLIIGDISALHDLNSLALARQARWPLVIVIINNDGGSIFNILPVPDQQIRQRYYRLEHGLEFGYGSAMFGLPYNRVEDLQSFNEAYQDALAYDGASVIEVRVSQTQASEQIAQMAQWVRQR